MRKTEGFLYNISRWVQKDDIFLLLIIGSAFVVIIISISGYCLINRDKSQGSEVPVIDKDLLHTLIERVDERKSNNVQPSSQNETIENKIVELDELRNKLIDRKQEVITGEIRYQHSIISLKREIFHEAKKGKLTDFEQAKKTSPRISYDISLIQSEGAYINKLMEIESRVSSGIYQLEYLERRAIDDFYLVNLVQNKAIDDLIKEIDKVISSYLPDAQKLVINVDVNTMQTPEQIWADILSGDTQEKGN